MCNKNYNSCISLELHYGRLVGWERGENGERGGGIRCRGEVEGGLEVGREEGAMEARRRRSAVWLERGRFSRRSAAIDDVPSPPGAERRPTH